MKQVFGKKGKIVVEDIPSPACKDDGLLVETYFSLISPGTELHSVKSRKKSLITLARERPDLVRKVVAHAKKAGVSKTALMVKSRLGDLIALGYSSAGIVKEVGKNVREFSVGDRVACAGAKYASHAEFVYVPKNLAVKIPENVSFEEAAFTTIGSIAMQGVRRASPTLGETFVVTGLGLIGMMAVQILKANGCKVVGIDLDESKTRLAKKLGADAAITPDKKPFTIVKKITGGFGADGVIITAATKSSRPVNEAMKLCRKKGRVVVIGDVGMDIERPEFYKKEIDFLISTSYGPGRYDPEYEEKGQDYPVGYVRWTENRNMEAFLELVSEKKINVFPLISRKFKISEAGNAYSFISSGKSITCLFEYGKKKKSGTKMELKGRTRKGKINVALIGAGSYAKSFHLPNLKAINNYEIYGIVTLSGQNAKAIARQYKANFFSTDWKDAIKDKKTSLVLISTRHDLHAPVTIAAANAGKDVFVEKPMALNKKELKDVAAAVRKNNINFMAGFQRRFSPFAVKAKDALDKKEGPWILNYVVNAGRLPKDHWAYDVKEGGGRIIGEGCHFFDMFNFFINSPVKEITAKSTSGSAEFISEDNVIATIKYEDGSLANLIYNSAGSPELPKEKLEIFRGGAAAVINDYKELELYGTKEKGFKIKGQDKGQLNQLKEFAKKIQGKDCQELTLDECISATEISFEVARQIKEN